MRAEFPLCSTCGAWSGSCGHPPDPRLRWQPDPLRDGLLDALGQTLFGLLYAAAAASVGPLLWWLFRGWPPRDWMEVLGVIMIALIAVPGLVIGVGVLLSIPESYAGRRWRLRDLAASDDDRFDGEILIRLGQPQRGELVHTSRTGLPAPASFALTTESAARTTGDPATLLAVAVAGLLARGDLELVRVHRTGWQRVADEGPQSFEHVSHRLRACGPETGAYPWIERTLLHRVHVEPDADLLRHIEQVTHSLADSLGFVYDEGHEHAPRWPEDVAPGEVLRARVLDEAGDLDDAPAVAAALDGWRAQHRDITVILAGIATVARLLEPSAARDDEHGDP